MSNIYIEKNGQYLAKDFKFYKSKKQAMRFPNSAEAERIMNNNVPSAQRMQCTILTESSNAKSKLTPNPKFVVIKNANTQSIAIEILSIIEEKAKLLGVVDEVNSLLNVGKDSLEKRHEYISSKLSVLDKEITDVIHYIEFNEFSEEDGFAAYKMLHEKTNERRTIKNEKYDIEFVLDVISGKKDLAACKTHFENKTVPTYVPRALPELFVKAV